MPPTPQDLFRSTLATQRNRGAGLSTSLVLHVAGLALLLALSAAKVEFVGARRSVLIEPLIQPARVELVAPPRRARKPPSTKSPNVPPARARFDLPKRPAAPTPKRQVIEARAPELVLPTPRLETPRSARPDIPLPAPAVRVGLLAEVAETPAPDNPPRLAVRAGSFSDIPLADDDRTHLPVERLAGFEPVDAATALNGRPRPAASAVGTFGRAEVAPAPGALAANSVRIGGGFGTAQPDPVLGKPAEIRSGGFSQVRAVKVDARRSDPKVPVPPMTPVRILEKPRPAYTDQARRLRIEGNVLLEVLFTAGGEVNVLGVVRGLDAGLDRNAVEAARKIRFEPARRDGQAMPTRALVTIQFQLAY